MSGIFEIIGLLLLASVKFLFAPSTTYALGYTFWQTIVISLLGGWFGVFVFYYAGGWVFDWWSKISKPSDKKFSKKNRIIVWFKNDFGLLGIILVLGFASIPIVSLLAAIFSSFTDNNLCFAGFYVSLGVFIDRNFCLVDTLY